jgi:RHS repeat-associated protein
VYDANGNITSITEGTNTIQYVYNELNEVVRENNQRDNKSFVYHYDLGGNLLSKVEYAYTTATLGTPLSTIAYAYTNTNWKDQLTSFNGKVITYDAIGNPLTYDGTTYSWQGRQLVSSSKAGLNINYTYNEAGIRTSKSVNGVTTSYRLSGDKVTFEQTGSDTIYYVYDTQGQLISMILNNVEYAYVRNAQNDIVGLINSAGIQVVSYTYSTWGEVLSITGSLASTVGQQNPYRYRGYRYDSETGLYYLQSRYYNPQWGRFVNADDTDTIGATEGLLTTNLFAYCVNNPVNMTDESGYWPSWGWNALKIAVGVVAIGVAVAATVATGGAAAPALIAALQVAGGGAAISAAIGGAFGFASGGWKGALNGAVDGACDGFALGGLGAAGSAIGKAVQVGGKMVVYTSQAANGTTQYVGITNNLARRAAEHLSKKGIQITKLIKGLNPKSARTVEQCLIEYYGLMKNGGTLINRINSIAMSNPAYADSLKLGWQLLKRAGFKG